MKKVKCDSSVDYEDSVIEGREWADDACRQLVKKKDKILEMIDDIVESDMLIIEGYAYGDKPSITEEEA